SGKVVAVHFWATSSGPSNRIAPILEGYSSLAQKLGISSAMPTFKIYRDGKQVDELCLAPTMGSSRYTVLPR
ncbi:hypothetical protein BGW80DRAFT_1309785, partial [Lactifluus volemus]